MKGFKSIPIKLKCEPITIKEPYKPDVKEFADTDDFTRYFRANEELFKEASDDPDKPPRFLTTNKLNRTYKIPGYRIRIIRKGTDNEELTLVKDYYNRTSDKEEPSNEIVDDSHLERIVELEAQIATFVASSRSEIGDIIERINNIESFLMQLKR